MKWPVSLAAACVLLVIANADRRKAADDADLMRAAENAAFADLEASSDAGEDMAAEDEADALAFGDAIVAGETYAEYDDRRDALDGSRGSFMGYGCTVDCSGHEAGYQWASRMGISDPDDCSGNSWSFIEGCRAYAESMDIVDASAIEHETPL
ncbi:hypothetical protein [Thermaurantiacus tibetensis]|uniref:hypothetical protein n=1 Tax=Thermaurantiacus tibetensis TaxID=2759035 RepID=UPI00188F373D|nr:hypothetical protein [Thermaurantiacus tibetensis]